MQAGVDIINANFTALQADVTVLQDAVDAFSVSSVGSAHIIPVSTDTYDLGSAARLWRKGYFSGLGVYDGAAELARAGDLNGAWGYVAATRGLAFGEYGASKPNLVVDGTNGLRIRNHSSDVLKFAAGVNTIEGTLAFGSNGKIRVGTPGSTVGTQLDDTGLSLYTGVTGLNVSIDFREHPDDASWRFGWLQGSYDDDTEFGVSNLLLKATQVESPSDSGNGYIELHAQGQGGAGSGAQGELYLHASVFEEGTAEANDPHPFVRVRADHTDSYVEINAGPSGTATARRLVLSGETGITITGDITTNNRLRLGSAGTYWDQTGAYTGGAPAATGYVSLKIGATTYKLLASNV